ncbi:alpha/beta hydrolase [Enterococcus plantarum]|uniref:Alpha/beta hydrolase n=1 Tax=Enterococcus plantarum TaxID=1077675 RepID=A0A2W3Z8D5_9ENTE|nr:alpha/beta hydrolase [Enterococcus plantarum]MBO0421786.1 alpha/beta hydrolase [Enterococcus plantarum]MBO0468372.1 alpha/beta hydrolase [Enterococcus plantarum]OEG21012.1 alpha/beta hydrolase [Enterococcus plantarum]PZL76208.1 alpha/beta hydrolase [Enterococcus plantarum]
MEKQKRTLVTADNSLIYYEISGKGFPLFLLHGNGGSGDYFEKQVPEFSRYFTVFTIDSRGHARSTNTSNKLTFDQMAEDLYSVMEQEQVVKANIIGFSDGANLAMVFTKKYPEKIHRLVLNAGNTVVSGVYSPIRIATTIHYIFLKFVALFNDKAYKKLQTVCLMMRDIGVSKSDLQQFSAKTLVIVGKYDIIKRAHSLYLAKEIPNASFVLVPKQGHSFAKKDPETFNQEILTFLQEK